MTIPSGIQALLFDLDNTLIDRDRAMKRALGQWLEEHAAVLPQDLPSELELVMQQDRSGHGDMLELCEWLMTRYGSKDSATAQSILSTLQELAIGHLAPEPALLAFLNALKKEYRLVLVSNGSSAVQRAKLSRAGLDSLFEESAIFISGETPYRKPQPEFYNHVLASLQLPARACLMTGDHYHYDVEAAIRCGLQACWLDRHDQHRPGQIEAHAIKHIFELEQQETLCK